MPETHEQGRGVVAGQSLTAQARAQQLAEVALAVYEAGGCLVIHLPLEPSNPLLAILKQAMEREGSERAVGQALAHALLENVLQAVDEQADSFPSLVVSILLLFLSCSVVITVVKRL